MPLKGITGGLGGEWKRGLVRLKKEIQDDRERIKSLLPTPPESSWDPDLSTPQSSAETLTSSHGGDTVSTSTRSVD